MALGDIVTRLITLEAHRQGVDPRLAVAVATQESHLNPNAVGDNGRSIGLFQLQKAAAQDVGLRDQDRYTPSRNIAGGVAYLKRQLDREDGHVERALSRYNRGTPTYQGIGDPRYVENVMGHYRRGTGAAPRSPGSASGAGPGARLLHAVSPASAEATTQESTMETSRDRSALAQRLQAIQALKAQRSGQSLAPAATPPPRSGEVDVQVLGPPGTSQGPREPVPMLASPTADTQVQLLQQQEQQRLAAERETGSPMIPAPTWLGKAGLATGISTAASAGGTALGTMAMPWLGPAAPAGPVLGEMAGSYLGRRANVALGLEEPGLVGDVASVAVPPALRGISKVGTPAAKAVGKAVIRHLPGASTAMHQEVAERIVKMGDSLLPPVDSRTLYGQAAQFNPGITPTAVARDAAEILQAERALQPSLRHSKLMRVANDLQKLTQAGAVPMDDFYAHQQRVGELVREARSKGGVGEGRIKQLYAAFHEDLETMAGKGVPGAQELKDAIAASRKEHIAAEFDELFAPGKHGVTIDPEGRISLNGGRMETAWKRTLNRDKVFRETLSKEEKAEVEDIIKYAQRLERLNVPKGGQRGSGRAAVGAAIGSLFGGPAGAAAGVYGPELIAKAMQTKAGRALVRQAMEETAKGGVDTTAINALAALVRQQMNAPAEAPPGP